MCGTGKSSSLFCLGSYELHICYVLWWLFACHLVTCIFGAQQREASDQHHPCELAFFGYIAVLLLFFFAIRRFSIAGLFWCTLFSVTSFLHLIMLSATSDLNSIETITFFFWYTWNFVMPPVQQPTVDNDCVYEMEEKSHVEIFGLQFSMLQDHPASQHFP